MGQAEHKDGASEMEDPHNKDEHHNSVGEYIKSAVYGGLDGLCTTLIIAISSIGSNASPKTVLALGIASMIGDGLGMAVADYLGTKSDDEYMLQEEERERREIENDLEAEKAEMVQLYNEMGLQPAVSNEIVQILSKNKEGFLKIMMIEELQLIAGEENPFTNSIVTFFSFAIFGVTPLIPSMVALALGMEKLETSIVIATIIVSAFFLGVLGLAKSCVGGMKWYISVPETILIGAISAGAAYAIGKAFGEDE